MSSPSHRCCAAPPRKPAHSRSPAPCCDGRARLLQTASASTCAAGASCDPGQTACVTTQAQPDVDGPVSKLQNTSLSHAKVGSTCPGKYPGRRPLWHECSCKRLNPSPLRRGAKTCDPGTPTCRWKAGLGGSIRASGRLVAEIPCIQKHQRTHGYKASL